MKLGILGGTFDPPHLGHLVLADQCARSLALDRVLFIPAWQPPHKLDRNNTPFNIRMEMVDAAIGGNSLFERFDIEGQRGGISYTVDTISQLKASRPGHQFHLLMGQDSLADMPNWKDPKRIIDMVRLGVYRRRGHYAQTPDWLEGRVDIVDGPQIDVSSTELRKYLSSRTEMRYLILEAVMEIIKREGLYQGR